MMARSNCLLLRLSTLPAPSQEWLQVSRDCFNLAVCVSCPVSDTPCNALGRNGVHGAQVHCLETSLLPVSTPCTKAMENSEDSSSSSSDVNLAFAQKTALAARAVISALVLLLFSMCCQRDQTTVHPGLFFLSLWLRHRGGCSGG